ncbi:FAD-dependent oxidoreductase [Parapedobacter pyrenivorans]|nr:FAD-dependent oxidoreductase [Parapedobacter pyrenivorans]
MNRRNFIKLSVPATGMALLAPSLASQALADINRQFTGRADFDMYDIVINGGGLRGYFAALHAVKAGKRVLLVERRSSFGYELAAKGRLWLGANGMDELPEDIRDLLWSTAESSEVHATAGTGPGGGVFGDELALMAGSFKKALLHNALTHKVDILLMTDVCGLFTEGKSVQGALLACKHGLFGVKCRQFIDASEHALFSRRLLGSDVRLAEATFTLEIWKTESPVRKSITVPSSLGVTDDAVNIHRGKHADHQVFLEFGFDATDLDMETVEHRARELAVVIGKTLPSLDPMFAGAEIMQFAWETTAKLVDPTLPKARLSGHHIISDTTAPADCAQLLAIQQEAAQLVAGLPNGSTAAATLAELMIVGSTIPKRGVALSEVDEPGLAIPLKRCTIDSAAITGRHDCQVFVAGGGTAGAMAAIGAVSKGASTIVADFFQDLGGTKTMCGVMGYYHGYRSQPYFKQQDDEANRLAIEAHMSKRLGRMAYLLQQTVQGDGRFFGNAILCGALHSDRNVQGGLVCRYGSLEAVHADVSIDATGDGDLAAFAGASFDHGDARTGKTQNYSQWDIRGAGKMPSNTNRDYDIIDNTRIGEVQRALFISHYEAHHYDFYPMMAVRESRRTKGEYELTLLDAVEGTHFADVLCLASSDFDPHYVGMSDYTRCGFLLPHSNDILVEIPYRSIVPKDLNGLLLSGRGFSQTQEAYQFTRMTSDLIVLGYLTGQIAADLSFTDTNARDYEVSTLQQEWAALGYYPEGLLSKPAGNRSGSPAEVKRRVEALSQGKREFLYDCIKLPKDETVPLLQHALQSVSDAPTRLLIAQALAWFGEKTGNELIMADLEALYTEERTAGYPADFVDNYDLIRGRKHNVLEGLYWRINQHIALLARAGYAPAKGTIRTILEHTTSGGPMMKRESDYFDGRIDLKLVPFHNRILNLSYFIERLPDAQFIPGLEALLQDQYIGGYRTSQYEKTRWRVYGGDLELFLAAALARSGGKRGYELLADYLHDVHHTFKTFAASELHIITGKEFNYDAAAWERLVGSLDYPRPNVPLNS